MNLDRRKRLSDSHRRRKKWLLVLGSLGLALVLVASAPVRAADCNENGIDDSLDPDTDGDGIPNACDNCRLTVNVAQTDSDEDGTGNRCDADLDNNGIVGLADYNVFRDCLGSPEDKCDLDEDGSVGLSDFSVLGSFFGGPKETGRQPVQLVRGYIQAVPLDNSGTPLAEIYLPNIEVHLRNVVTEVASYSVRTDLSGRFSLAIYQPGVYEVCWTGEGFEPGCSERVETSGQRVGPVHLGNIPISEESTDTNPAIFGRVQLQDGSEPRILIPALSLNQVAEVALLELDGTPRARVYVNNFGNYYLPSVPTTGASQFAVFLGENQIASQQVYPGSGPGFPPSHAMDLVVRNRAPRIKPIAAAVDGRRVRVASPGSNVSLGVSAVDPDGDTIRYEWWLDGNAGTLRTPDSAATEWELPAEEGFYTVHLLVRDDGGGHARSTLNLRVTDDGVPFSGLITGPGGAVVAGAQVEINGVSTVSNAAGRFSADVPDRDRFVFNVRAAGYALLSQIYDDGMPGGRWTLNRGSVISVDPTSVIQITHNRDEEDCPGPRSLRQNYASFPGIEEPVWQDGAGNVVAAFDTPPVELPGPGRVSVRDCPPGVSVTIPADSLRDADGNSPAGLVEITLSTVDLFSPQQMPGDYTVLAADGSTTSMQSFGAAGIEIQAAGTAYNLKGGTTAEVRIPVDPSQLAAGGSYPATIPALYYDESNGVWREEGVAQLVGNEYVYTASHFSTINMDLLKDNPACVRVLSPDLPPKYELEIQVPNAGAAPTLQSPLIVNESPQTHMIYNLPTNTNIVLVPIRLPAEDSVAPEDPAPMGTFIVNTGGAQGGDDNPPLFGDPENPYSECATEVLLFDRAVPEAPGGGQEFLTGLLTFAALRTTELGQDEPEVNALGLATALKADLNEATAAYYKEIDPRGKRLTLEDFYNYNNFGGDTGSFSGSIEASTTFANAGDLGFGREMHCRKSGGDVACYVTNYGYIHTDDLVDLKQANEKKMPVATVAMEYSRIESKPAPGVAEFDESERVVKFYVYEGGYNAVANPSNPAPGGLLPEADLDNRGDRPVPQLCMVCHGGFYKGGPVLEGAPAFATRDDVKLGSQFVPFDLSLYEFESPADKLAQQSAFKLMNEMVSYVASKPVGDPPVASAPEIVAVVAEMYSGGNPGIQEEEFVVPLWSGDPLQEQMYREVLAPSCRMCHLAVADVAPGGSASPLRFGSHADFVSKLAKAETRTCEPELVMPHAKVTHELFWTSVGPHQPAIFQLYGDQFNAGGWAGSKCGSFTPGGDTPVTAYEEDIQSIYDSSGCGSCHYDEGMAADLSPIRLDNAADSYATTVDLDAPQTGNAMKLIKPGSAEESYLWHKIKGTHLDPPSNGSGTGMPPFDALEPAVILVIEAWINEGATND